MASGNNLKAYFSTLADRKWLWIQVVCIRKYPVRIGGSCHDHLRHWNSSHGMVTYAIVIVSLIPRPVLPHSQLLLPHSQAISWSYQIIPKLFLGYSKAISRLFPACTVQTKQGRICTGAQHHIAGHLQLTAPRHSICKYPCLPTTTVNTFEGTQIMSFTSTAAPKCTACT